MDTCSKLGEVWGKWPVADGTNNLLLLSMCVCLVCFFFKQDQSCKRFDLYSGTYIFYTPKLLNIKHKDVKKEKQNATI